MRDQSLRAPFVAGLLLTILAGVRAAHAQGDAGAPPPAAAPTVTVSPDGGAPPPPAESGGGLFEQSQATAAPAADTAAVASTPPFTINGYARGDVFIGKIQDVDGTQMKANYGELALQLRTAKVAYGDGFADLRVRYGLMGDQQGTFVDMREAYVNTYLGPVDLRLGKQIVVWGRADALNPTNNITPVDFRLRSPLEDDIRLGNVGARGFLRMGVARLFHGMQLGERVNAHAGHFTTSPPPHPRASPAPISQTTKTPGHANITAAAAKSPQAALWRDPGPSPQRTDRRTPS